MIKAIHFPSDPPIVFQTKEERDKLNKKIANAKKWCWYNPNVCVSRGLCSRTGKFSFFKPMARYK